MSINKRAILSSLALFVGTLFIFTACEVYPPSETEAETYNLYQNLEIVKGAEKTSVTITQGRDAYFEFDISNFNANAMIAPGVHEGWCIEWTKPIAQQGETHEGLQMYSTFGKDRWKPLNYFLNIKDRLQKEDPDLTYKEFQAVIWTVAEGPEFDLHTLSNEQIPARLMKDGELDFSKEKVFAITDEIRAKAAAFEYNSNTTFALFMKTGDDEQDVMVPSDPPAEVNIEMVDLGSLPDRKLHEARAINDNGQVTGLSHTPSPITGWAFLWEEGTGMTALDRYPEDPIESGSNRDADAFAYAINDKGQIAGYQFPYALKWLSPTDWTILGEGIAYGINDDGDIVGEQRKVYDDYVGSDAILWDEMGNEIILESLSESLSAPVNQNHNSARDINNVGQIAGYSSLPEVPASESRRAVIWADGVISRELGTLGGNSEALAINDQGQVVGRSEIMVDGVNQYRAFIWDEVNGMVSLGTIDNYESEATGINNNGQVVGNILIPATGSSESMSRGFYWDEEHGMILLEPLEETFSFSFAYGINEYGIIVGTSSSDEILVTRAVTWKITFEESGKITP